MVKLSATKKLYKVAEFFKQRAMTDGIIRCWKTFVFRLWRYVVWF